MGQAARASGRKLFGGLLRRYHAHKSGRGGRNDNERAKCSRPNECQEIRIDDVGVRGRHTVWEPRVRLQRGVLQDFDCARTRGGIWHDLVGLTVQNEGRNGDFLEVSRVVLLMNPVMLS